MSARATPAGARHARRLEPALTVPTRWLGSNVSAIEDFFAGRRSAAILHYADQLTGNAPTELVSRTKHRNSVRLRQDLTSAIVNFTYIGATPTKVSAAFGGLLDEMMLRGADALRRRSWALLDRREARASEPTIRVRAASPHKATSVCGLYRGGPRGTRSRDRIAGPASNRATRKSTQRNGALEANGCRQEKCQRGSGIGNHGILVRRTVVCLQDGSSCGEGQA